jgi:hypothetical protein
MGTGIVAALIDGHFFFLFPGEEGVLAVGAVVLGFSLAESFFLLKELSADLAEELGSLFAVVVVEIGMRRLAGGAAGGFRDPRGAGPVVYWGQRFSMLLLIGGQQIPPIPRGGRLFFGATGLGKRS